MAAEGQFGALLQAFQSPHARYDPQRYLGAALSSLLTLNNPLNVTLLTNQLLTASALWSHASHKDFPFAFLSLFHTATAKVEARDAGDSLTPTLALGSWIKAITQGIDERSHPARHVLVLGGVIVGLGTQARQNSSWRELGTLQKTFTDAANAAIQDPSLDQYAQTGLVLALTHAFALLGPDQLARLDYDLLLPVLMHAMLHSPEGLGSLDVLRDIDQDVVQSGPSQFAWNVDTPSFSRLHSILDRPLVRALGPLARLIAHALDHVRDSSIVLATIQDVRDFAVLLHSRWYANKLSEVDSSEEHIFLSPQTVQQSLSALFALLRSVLFASVIVLRGALCRSFGDRTLANTFIAPRLAKDILTSLRHLHFILSRLSASFGQHEFLFLAALDILTAHPTHASEFLSTIAPSHPGTIPPHPLDRSLDHFFFNTAEHCPAHSALYHHTTSPYVGLPYSAPSLLPIVEAAHSLTLSILAAPASEALALDRIPGYIDVLQRALYTGVISERQFRIAFKVLVKVANNEHMKALDAGLGDVVMEVLYHGAVSASAPEYHLSQPQMHSQAPAQSLNQDQARATHLLALIESLVSCNPASLDEWLNLAAQAISTLPVPARSSCANALWDVIYGGQMDDLRTQVCVIWWVHKDGRELVFGRHRGINAGAKPGAENPRSGITDGEQMPVMSGALPPAASSARL